MSEFPPIADYALLSDCETVALVAPDGQVEWFCLPRSDGPSVFGAMLDRSAGYFRFGPARAQVPSQRRYLPGSMVLETTWCLPTGCLVVRDSLAMGTWSGQSRRAAYRRPPGDFVALHVMVRTAECIEGEVDLECDCLPLFDYGRNAGHWEYAGDGYGAARCVDPGSVDSSSVDPGGVYPAQRVPLTLYSNLNLGLSGAHAGARRVLRAGDEAFLALSWGDRQVDDLNSAVGHVTETAGLWRGWLRRATLPDHRWRPYLERSALTLKALTYAPTGAILAAATTSLPETPGGERNWDYRFSWIRDSAFLLHALQELGFDWEALQYFTFLMDTVASGPLQIMYGIGLERDLTESTLEHLSGYEGARPVRIGNGAWDQTQHDMWGMLLDSVATHLPHPSQLAPPGWELVKRLVDRAIEMWRAPDRGIWEVRGEPRHFTASKALCWVAADRGAGLAAARGEEQLAKDWRAVADEIHADVCAHGVDERGVFVQHYETSALDASVLLLPLMGFLPPTDERVRKTVLAIADELTEDGLVLRYRTGETDDGLSGAEGSFAICSFWLVAALARIGEVTRARSLCEKLLSLASPLHLYAEEIDAASGLHLGNFPQAFTHLALIDAVLSVIRAEGQE